MTDSFPVPFGSPEHRGGKRGSMLLALAVLFAASPSSALAQGGEKKDSVGAEAVDAVTQPLSDLNLRTKDIPLILQIAQAAPYDLASLDGCRAVHSEIERLEQTLGPDADAPEADEGLVNRGLQLGGNLLSGFIPFRGLIRQISGANAEQARWEAAIYAGVARRSFLKGYAKGMGCAAPEEAAIQSAEQVLGLVSRETTIAPD